MNHKRPTGTRSIGVIGCLIGTFRWWFIDKQEVEAMKVKVDHDLCTGDEICVQVCPEVFEMEDDKAIVRQEEVPEELQDSVREAADSCPSEAIIIEE
jgi:ferredoxin